MKLRQTARFDLVAEAAFGNDESALPVIAAIEQHQQLAVLKKAKRLSRIILFLGNPHPEDVDRYAKLASLKTGAHLSDRMSSIRSDDEVCMHLQLATRRFCEHASHAVVLEDKINNFVFHEQLEIRKSFCVTGNEIEKIPLRHKSDEFAARRELREISDRHDLSVNDTAQLSRLLMRFL